MSLIDTIRTYAEGAAATASKTLLRPSGWEVPGGAGVGATVGAVAKGGGGYEKLPVRRLGAKSGYMLEGAYVEGGAGYGADVDVAVVGKVVARFVKIAGSFSGSTMDFWSGGLSQLHFGPKCTQAALSRADFENSAWLYLFVGGTLAVGTADVGLLFLMDGRASVEAVLKSMVTRPGALSVPWMQSIEIAKIIWDGTRAWCPYYGTGLSLGAQVGAMARGIGIVKISDTTF